MLLTLEEQERARSEMHKLIDSLVEITHFDVLAISTLLGRAHADTDAETQLRIDTGARVITICGAVKPNCDTFLVPVGSVDADEFAFEQTDE